MESIGPDWSARTRNSHPENSVSQNSSHTSCCHDDHMDVARQDIVRLVPPVKSRSCRSPMLRYGIALFLETANNGRSNHAYVTGHKHSLANSFKRGDARIMRIRRTGPAGCYSDSTLRHELFGPRLIISFFLPFPLTSSVNGI